MDAPRPGMAMFHARLLLVAAVTSLAWAPLAARLYDLTAVEGQHWREQAESALVGERLTPTLRGTIYDRKGRALAIDRAAFDVRVAYPRIDGSWVNGRAERLARESAGESWAQMGRAQRDQASTAMLADAQRELDDYWDQIAGALGVERAQLDERRVTITKAVERMGAYQRRWWLERARAEFEEAGARGRAPTLDDIDKRIREELDTHAVAHGVSEEAARAVRVLALRLQDLRVVEAPTRVYPLETVSVTLDRGQLPGPLREEDGGLQTITVRGVDTHIVGWMRDAQKEDLDRRPLRVNGVVVDAGGYAPDDLAGGAGIEGACEDTLRGIRGSIRERRDTGEQMETPAVAGGDVHLTIDAMLQARIAAMLEPDFGMAVVQEWQLKEEDDRGDLGLRLPVAVAVVDVKTAEVLALVSSPTFTREQRSMDPASVYGDPVLAPFVNRALTKPYPPGSVVKPFILAAAVSSGVHRLDRAIRCTGHLLPDVPDKYRCWIAQAPHFTTHQGSWGGGLKPEEAIAWSCNIYFYTLGRDLGPERIASWYHKMGVENPEHSASLGIKGTFEGWIGGRAGADPLTLAEATMAGMGQGPLAWTPLHAANCYATLANNGVYRSPRLIKEASWVQRDLKLDGAALKAALRGLHDVLDADARGTAVSMDFGTGQRERIIKMDGVDVWGKTGTAQASPITHDPDGPDGSAPARVVRAGNHAWFAMLAGREGKGPEYAIAVLVEHAGSGGRAAGPLANQILRALRDEGYL